jgi:hypothetical protein
LRAVGGGGVETGETRATGNVGAVAVTEAPRVTVLTAALSCGDRASRAKGARETRRAVVTDVVPRDTALACVAAVVVGYAADAVRLRVLNASAFAETPLNGALDGRLVTRGAVARTSQVADTGTVC